MCNLHSKHFRGYCGLLVLLLALTGCSQIIEEKIPGIQTPVPLRSGTVFHSVQKGETLDEIAAMYDVTPQRIVAKNLLEGEFIIAGQELIIPRNASESAIHPRSSVSTVSSAPAHMPLFLLKPCNSSCFVTQFYSDEHRGIDVQTRGGGPIFAAADGTVVRSGSGWNEGYGTMVEIDHGFGLMTLYGHNKDLYLKKGDTVTAGQVIGFMGNSGNVRGPTGIHLHFEVRVNGQQQNPLQFFADSR